LVVTDAIFAADAVVNWIGSGAPQLSDAVSRQIARADKTVAGNQSRPVPPSEAEQARMLQPEDCGRTIAFVASLPPRVCINEILISPTHNRGFIATPKSND
nr:hypothetical protein [Promineifilum sp.]